MADEKKKLSWADMTVKDPFDEEQEEEILDEDEQEEEDEKDEEEEVKPAKKDKKVKDKAKTKDSEEEESEEEEVTEPVKEKEPKKDKPSDKEKDKEEEEEEPTDDAGEFFSKVATITGNDLDVDYGETDPLSPEGVALYSNAVRTQALESFLEEIETKYPKVFKALEHANAGGDPAELFKITASRDYSKVTIGETDEALARQILTEYYKSKGISNEAKIAKWIEGDEDSEQGLVGAANEYLKELQASQKASEDEIVAKQKVSRQEESKKDGLLLSAIDDVVGSGKLGSFKFASKQEQIDFKKYVTSTAKIRKTSDGKYEFATAIDPQNLEKILQYQFFEWKKGELDKFITVKASSQNAAKLRLKVAEETAANKGKSSGGKEKETKPSLKTFGQAN